MDLKKLNVVELNKQEAKQIEGGLYPLLLLGIIAYIAGYSYYCSQHPEDQIPKKK